VVIIPFSIWGKMPYDRQKALSVTMNGGSRKKAPASGTRIIGEKGKGEDNTIKAELPHDK